MNQPLKKNKDYPAIIGVKTEADKIVATMSDGREVSVPVAWFPRLFKATDIQCAKMEISPGGYGIHWPDVDEDISIKAFMDGL